MVKCAGNSKICEECKKAYSETLYGPIGLSFCADCWYTIDSDEEEYERRCGGGETNPNRKRIYEEMEECEMEEDDEQDEEGKEEDEQDEESKEVDYTDEDSNQNETDDSFSREMWEYVIETKSQDVSKSDEEKEKLD